jgi:hypothetical protein
MTLWLAVSISSFSTADVNPVASHVPGSVMLPNQAGSPMAYLIGAAGASRGVAPFWPSDLSVPDVDVFKVVAE